MANDNINVNSVTEAEGTIPAGLPGNIMRKRMEDGNNKALMLVGTGQHTDYTYLDSSGVSQTVSVYDTEPIRIIEGGSEQQYMLRTTEDSIAFCPMDNNQIEKVPAQWAIHALRSKLNFNYDYDNSIEKQGVQTITSNAIYRDETKTLIYKIKLEVRTSLSEGETAHYIIDGGFCIIYPQSVTLTQHSCLGCGYQSTQLSEKVIIYTDLVIGGRSYYKITAELNETVEWAKLSWKQII